jgi:hypothetical protein
MMTLPTATCLLLLLSSQAPMVSVSVSVTRAPSTEPLDVRHVPVSEVAAGTGLVLRAQVAPVWRLASLVAHSRAAGETAFHDTVFELSADGSHAAVIPVPPEQRAPVEYYLTALDTDGVESVRFASASAPFPVRIDVPRSILERELLLDVYGQRRSRVSAFGEYVDYGASAVNGTRFADRYYRLEVDYLYRLFTQVGDWRVDSIRIGVGHLRAWTPPFEQEETRPGLDYGFSEVDVSVHPLVGLGVRLVLGGNLSGFAPGFGGKLRIGRPHGSRAELEGEYTQGLGGSGMLRLAWDTVPRFPMSAAVQVTNVPSGPVGLRLLYRVAYQFSDAVSVGAQAGYQARTSNGGGPTLGVLASYGW